MNNQQKSNSNEGGDKLDKTTFLAPKEKKMSDNTFSENSLAVTH